MLLLGKQKIWVKWQAAGVELLLSPLSLADRQKFAIETTEYVKADDGKILDVKRDVAGYSKRIGRACLHDWRGVKQMLPDGKIVDAFCTGDAIDEFMSFPNPSDFVINAVEGLALSIAKSVEEAGNDSAALPSGTAEAALKA